MEPEEAKPVTQKNNEMEVWFMLWQRYTNVNQEWKDEPCPKAQKRPREEMTVGLKLEDRVKCIPVQKIKVEPFKGTDE